MFQADHQVQTFVRTASPPIAFSEPTSLLHKGQVYGAKRTIVLPEIAVQYIVDNEALAAHEFDNVIEISLIFSPEAEQGRFCNYYLTSFKGLLRAFERGQLLFFAIDFEHELCPVKQTPHHGVQRIGRLRDRPCPSIFGWVGFAARWRARVRRSRRLGRGLNPELKIVDIMLYTLKRFRKTGYSAGIAFDYDVQSFRKRLV
jgi:hypothetical protein